jgi:hypothetical protein
VELSLAQRDVFQLYAIQEPFDYNDYFKASIDCDGQPDLVACLQERHFVHICLFNIGGSPTPYYQLIKNYMTGMTSLHIIQIIFVKIDWIRFTDDYNKLKSGQKITWLQNTFKMQHEDKFDGLSELESKAKLAEMAEEFKKWKKTVGNNTTVCNRLHQLFLTVR